VFVDIYQHRPRAICAELILRTIRPDGARNQGEIVMRSTLLALTALLAVGVAAPSSAATQKHKATVASQQARDWNTCVALARSRGYMAYNDRDMSNTGSAARRFVNGCMNGTYS
jgi:hypothetical protein